MPLRVSLDPKRSPNYRIRGTVCGERVDESSGVAGKREAEKIAERLSSEIRQRHIDGPRAPEKAELTFAGAVLNFIQDPTKSEGSKRFLSELLRHFGTRPLSEIDQPALDAYIRTRHADQAPATVQRQTITPLCAVLRHAGLVPIFRRPKISNGRLRYLTEDEADRLIAAAAPHLKPLITFCIHTGARMGEALSLEWSEVDLKQRRVAFVDTKNGASRGVPLNVPAWHALVEMTYPGMNKGERITERSGRVFRTHRGDAYPLHDVGGGQIKTGWAAACRRASIDGATPHTMRHTFASWLVMKGVHPQAVSNLMGHKSPNMVARYSHLSPGHLASAVALLGQNTGYLPDSKEKAE